MQVLIDVKLAVDYLVAVFQFDFLSADELIHNKDYRDILIWLFFSILKSAQDIKNAIAVFMIESAVKNLQIRTPQQTISTSTSVTDYLPMSPNVKILQLLNYWKCMYILLLKIRS